MSEYKKQHTGLMNEPNRLFSELKNLKDKYGKNIAQALIVLILLVILVCIVKVKPKNEYESSSNEDINSLKSSIETMREKSNTIIDMYEDVEPTEYTGTIEPFTYIAEITDIDIEIDSIYGITSNKDTYSGLIRFDFSKTKMSVNTLEKFRTYNITCKPLIRDTIDGEKVTPYVEVISIEKSTTEDINRLKESKEELSRYIEFRVEYDKKPLDEIIQTANKLFYKWTDEDILDYQEWIQSLGYTNDKDNGVVSVVKTIQQLKNEQ